jgi:hypothetical protein
VLWVFNVFLKLYPRDQRELFADEMRRVFRQEAEEYRARSGSAYRRFVLGEVTGLMRGAAAGLLETRAVVAFGAFVAALGLR